MDEAEGNAVDGLISAMDQDLDDAAAVVAMRETIPNLEKIDDTEVLGLYRKGAEGKAGSSDEGSGGTAEGEAGLVAEPWGPKGYSFTDDKGEQVKLTPEILSFLEKAGVNYRALGADHRKSFSDVVRNASRGHLNDRREKDLVRQVEELTKSGGESTESKAGLQKQLDAWDNLLQRAAQGDGQPFVNMVNRYKQQVSSGQEIFTAPAAAEAPMSQADIDATNERGMNEYVRPHLEQVAAQYGITDGPALEKWAVAELEKSSAQTPTEVKFWFENTMLHELDQLGYGAPAAEATVQSTGPGEITGQADPRDAEIANLKNALAQKAAGVGPPASGGGDEGVATGDKKIAKMDAREMWAELKAR